MYPKILIFKLPNFSNKDAFKRTQSIWVSLTFYLHSFLLLTSTSLQNLKHRITRNRWRNHYTLNKSYLHWPGIATCLYSQLTKLWLISRNMNYLMKNLKAGLYFSIQPDKIWKSETFTTFKIHRSFLNNLKSEETKSQIKVHLSYLANFYFYNYKASPRILHQHCV